MFWRASVKHRKEHLVCSTKVVAKETGCAKKTYLFLAAHSAQAATGLPAWE
jgi:hypothetical protein